MNNFYKYFVELPILSKLILFDLINDLINSIDVVNKLSKDYSLKDEKYKKNISLIVNTLQELGFLNISWLINYKKTDYTPNRWIKESIDITSPQNISKLSVARRWFIIELCKIGIIEDTKLSISDLFTEEEMEKQKLIIRKENWDKKFDFEQLRLNDNNTKLKAFWKDIVLNNENIQAFALIFALNELKKYYWEDELNRELNLDKSFKQILFFKANKKELVDLLFNLQRWLDKSCIEKVEYKEKWLYVNWERFIPKWDKTMYFLELICLYFFENPKRNKVSISDFIDFYEKNKEKWKELNLKESNIKNWYLKTIRQNLWEEFVNNEILKIEKSHIIKI